MVIAPFTLAVAPAKANYDAVRIQADDINAKGGINGHKVDVIGCDDQTDPNVAAKCAQQAVSEQVVAILGQFSLVGPAIWPIINAAGIPEIGLIQYGSQEQIAPTAWPIDPAVVMAEGSATGYLAAKKGCKNIADAQADAGEAGKVPVALNKAASPREGPPTSARSCSRRRAAWPTSRPSRSRSPTRRTVPTSPTVRTASS